MSASSILSRGISPQDKSGSTTGLVVGYVQSGKTLSFETVIAMARDNEFALSIVVAGTSNPLFDQSTGRLKKDLKLTTHMDDLGRCLKICLRITKRICVA